MSKPSFITHNTDPKIEISATSLMGYIDISYNELVDVLGKPTTGDPYKVDAEWVILFEGTCPATIYNYKDGHNYLGQSGLDVDKIRDWHIGGKDSNSVLMVHLLFPKAPIITDIDYMKIWREHYHELSMCWPRMSYGDKQRFSTYKMEGASF
jgi:hypothetical protein